MANVMPSVAGALAIAMALSKGLAFTYHQVRSSPVPRQPLQTRIRKIWADQYVRKRKKETGKGAV